jgi:simple sugar transport system permease protein
MGSAHVGVLVAVGMAVAVTVALAYSAWGLRVRALGLGPEASEAAGVAVGRLRLQVMALSGGLAGLAGALEVQGVTHRLFEAFSPGTGYTAIAVALLARLQPLAVLPSALFFGGLDAGAELMEATQGVPSALTWVVQAVVILASALWFRQQIRGGGLHG